MRTILHSDINSCYASIELVYHPQLRGRPFAVGGDPEARHGIVLAKNQLAKKAGVKTGMALWQARQICPDIQFILPHYDLYLRFSRLAHEIYADYTDLQEPFGIDECWLDVTDSAGCRGDGMTIAGEIRRRMKTELGVTVSIGVSWNKIFAKFGSDYRKPDAITQITPDNYRDIVWNSPAQDLLFVGHATRRKLARVGIHTIGDIARADPEFLHRLLGKAGLVLYMFANGDDQTPVSRENFSAPIKSIGNGTTTPRDLVSRQDVLMIVYELAENVSRRMKENGFRGRTVEIWVRGNDLCGFTRQKKVCPATDITEEIVQAAMELFDREYDWRRPIRSLGVRCSDLVPAQAPRQLDLFVDEDRRDRLRRMNLTVDKIRSMFGYGSIGRGIMYLDRELCGFYGRLPHSVHPHGYFEAGNRSGVDRLALHP